MTTVWIATFICLVWSAPPGAQAKPDFSGTWKEDQSAKAVALPSDTIIRQTPTALTIERKLSGVRFVYALNGTESVNRNGDDTQTTRSRWEGARLVTEGSAFSSTTDGQFTRRFREVRWLDETGAMIVESTITDQEGKTSVATSVFQRKRQKR